MMDVIHKKLRFLSFSISAWNPLFRISLNRASSFELFEYNASLIKIFVPFFNNMPFHGPQLYQQDQI